MNWFQQNRFLGSFLAALVLATLLSGYFLLHQKGAADEAQASLESTVQELTRLRRGNPFPNKGNLEKTRAQVESYRSSLLALEDELKRRMFPKNPLQPNEFQAQLRAASTDVIERAQSAKVRLPDNFNLGFDEYASSLPNSLAAPRLGRQLRAIEWLARTVIEAHVDSLNTLTRTPLPEEKAESAPTATPGRGARPPKATAPTEKIVDWTTIDLTFSGSPASLRRVINQIATAKEQLYVVRTLQVRNQVDKGPKREAAVETPATATPPAGGKAAERGITFIVGTEHVDVAAKIEILRFTVPEKEAR